VNWFVSTNAYHSFLPCLRVSRTNIYGFDTCSTTACRCYAKAIDGLPPLAKKIFPGEHLISKPIQETDSRITAVSESIPTVNRHQTPVIALAAPEPEQTNTRPEQRSKGNVTKTSYHKRYQRYYRGKGVSNLTDEIIHNLMAQDRP